MNNIAKENPDIQITFRWNEYVGSHASPTDDEQNFIPTKINIAKDFVLTPLTYQNPAAFFVHEAVHSILHELFFGFPKETMLHYPETTTIVDSQENFVKTKHNEFYGRSAESLIPLISKLKPVQKEVCRKIFSLKLRLQISNS